MFYHENSKTEKPIQFPHCMLGFVNFFFRGMTLHRNEFFASFSLFLLFFFGTDDDLDRYVNPTYARSNFPKLLV